MEQFLIMLLRVSKHAINWWKGNNLFAGIINYITEYKRACH